MLDTVDVDPTYLGVTLDVGHAKINGEDCQEFVERFGERIRVCHLHDNDGTADRHKPLPAYEPLVEAVPADCFVFEMKTVADVATSVGVDAPPRAIGVERRPILSITRVSISGRQIRRETRRHSNCSAAAFTGS